MKFKMAEKSLFAVLLRSPWWISFVVVAIIALAAGALLPKDMAVVGALGGLPFFVVGCIAAWRQLQAPAPRKVAEMQEAIASMPWRSFAAVLTSAFTGIGQTVEQLGDAAVGADLRLNAAGTTTLVSARRWKAATHGVEPLRELQAAMRAQDASKGIYIAALGTVSEAASTFAREHGITVLHGEGLARLLLKKS